MKTPLEIRGTRTGISRMHACLPTLETLMTLVVCTLSVSAVLTTDTVAMPARRAGTIAMVVDRSHQEFWIPPSFDIATKPPEDAPESQP